MTRSSTRWCFCQKCFALKSNLNFFSLKFYRSELDLEHFFGARVSTLGPSNCITSSNRFEAWTWTTKYWFFFRKRSQSAGPGRQDRDLIITIRKEDPKKLEEAKKKPESENSEDVSSPNPRVGSRTNSRASCTSDGENTK